MCDPKFAEMQDILSANLDSGADVGASVAVTIDGEFVVDMWGGHTDESRTTPWTEHTITNVWSTTKTMTAISALRLVEQGRLDVFAPVAKYWPEFAQNGKDHIEVRHLMSHTSGVSGWDQPVTVADVYDWERSTAMLAGQAPWWEPGTRSGYHALCYGHLIGEVIRRIDGRGLKQFFAEEIAGPLDADFQIGVATQDLARVSDNIPPHEAGFDLTALDPTLPIVRTLTGPTLSGADANTAEWRAADMGGVNGHGNAHSVARIQQLISNNGTVDGVHLLSPDTIDLIFQEQAHGSDLVLVIPLRWGIGYGLPETQSLPYIPEGNICFWGGWGGSMVVNDRDRHVTMTYMMNRMERGIIGCPRSAALISAAYRAVP